MLTFTSRVWSCLILTHGHMSLPENKELNDNVIQMYVWRPCAHLAGQFISYFLIMSNTDRILLERQFTASLLMMSNIDCTRLERQFISSFLMMTAIDKMFLLKPSYLHYLGPHAFFSFTYSFYVITLNWGLLEVM